MQSQISSLKLHPDGLILAIGLTNGKILIYDIRQMILSAELEAPVSSLTSSTTPVKNIEFSNKGINMAVSWSE